MEDCLSIADVEAPLCSRRSFRSSSDVHGNFRPQHLRRCVVEADVPRARRSFPAASVGRPRGSSGIKSSRAERAQGSVRVTYRSVRGPVPRVLPGLVLVARPQLVRALHRSTPALDPRRFPQRVPPAERVVLDRSGWHVSEADRDSVAVASLSEREHLLTPLRGFVAVVVHRRWVCLGSGRVSVGSVGRSYASRGRLEGHGA